ncbi:hypothetical protein D2A34_21870 [Clostridium chromiireducens]|uniref:Uncharacterized protein n=1 Tax=Clostridium chromiireducens TaxID=225345 RepID=A0A399IPF2_9CLOT|nr:hypothetical protein [Clostridium chromiireducens]RII32846.1 hypothetical protein D2A34_21870 [Clostridium chromiireducens]
MAIKVIEGKVNVDGDLKEVGAKLKMKEVDEKRLVNLGFAEFYDGEADEVEVIYDEEAEKSGNGKGGK